MSIYFIFSCFAFSVWHCWVALIQIGLKNGLPRVTDYPLWHQSRFWNPDLAPLGLTPRYQTNYFPATDLTLVVQFFGTIGFGTKIPNTSSSYLGTNLSPVISLFGNKDCASYGSRKIIASWHQRGEQFNHLGGGWHQLNQPSPSPGPMYKCAPFADTTLGAGSIRGEICRSSTKGLLASPATSIEAHYHMCMP